MKTSTGFRTQLSKKPGVKVLGRFANFFFFFFLSAALFFLVRMCHNVMSVQEPSVGKKKKENRGRACGAHNLIAGKREQATFIQFSILWLQIKLVPILPIYSFFVILYFAVNVFCLLVILLS